MSVRNILIAGAISFVSISQAMATPFCMELTGIPLQCMYFDPTICAHDAAREGGRCAANPNEFVTPVTASGYCLVTAGNVVSCIYPDQADCVTDSHRLGGACVAAIPPPRPAPNPAPGVDLFAVTRPW